MPAKKTVPSAATPNPVWIPPDHLKLFRRFLEIEPAANNHGNIKVLPLSFYSSELKSVKQIVDKLAAFASGDGHGSETTERSEARYDNTLLNLGVIQEGVGITDLGRQVLKVGQETSGEEIGPRTTAVDQTIFTALLPQVTAPVNPRAAKHFTERLVNAQIFFDAMPADEHAKVLGDDDWLLFLQLINATRFEVPRFWRLSATERDTVVAGWKSTLANAPKDAPTGDTAFVYPYVETKLKNRLQRDAVHRIRAFLTAYQTARAALGDSFPRIDPALWDHEQKIRLFVTRMPTAQVITPRAALAPVAQPRNLIVSGCPGSGKSFQIAEWANGEGILKPEIRTVFHAETSYFDFVGSYKPSPVYETGGTTSVRTVDGRAFAAGRPLIDYRFVPGPFIDAFVTAKQNPTWNVILVIEELNRANCGAVFGDIFQLLDRDAQGVSHFPIAPNPDLAAYLTTLGFTDDARAMKLPGNLHIWCSMNNADQGVLPLDSAFRRRWSFRYLGYNLPCKYQDKELRYGDAKITWGKFRERINQFLTENQIHEDKLIGPYFLTEQELDSSDAILNKLFLYLWDDVLRFNQRRLMDFKSFSELATDWNGGKGKPLAAGLKDV